MGIGMHKTSCSGETRLVLHMPASSRAGKLLVMMIVQYLSCLCSLVASSYSLMHACSLLANASFSIAQALSRKLVLVRSHTD